MRFFLERSWHWARDNQGDLMLGIAVAAISVISFQTGKLYQANLPPDPDNTSANLNGLFNLSEPAGAKQQPSDGEESSAVVSSTPVRTDLRVVASKNSKSKRYHYLWCGSAKTILEQNRVYFASDSAAEAQGYTLAGNCTK